MYRVLVDINWVGCILRFCHMNLNSNLIYSCITSELDKTESKKTTIHVLQLMTLFHGNLICEIEEIKAKMLWIHNGMRSELSCQQIVFEYSGATKKKMYFSSW